MERGSLRRGQRGVECLILGLVERTVEVVGLAPVVTGGGKHLLIVEALRRHDGGHGVVEVEALIAGQAADLVRQRTVRQRAGGHEDGGALVDVLHPLPVNGDVRLSLHHPGDFGAEGVAVHGQRTACGHAGRLGGVQELTAHPAHLLFQQAGGGVQTFGFQAVGADELREALALVGRGEVGRLLLIELHLHAFSRQPEGRFAARQTGTQYSNFILIHSFIFSFSVLALSVSLPLASSPKGGATGVPVRLAWDEQSSIFRKQ